MAKNENICEFLHNTNLTLSAGLNCEAGLGNKGKLVLGRVFS